MSQLDRPETGFQFLILLPHRMLPLPSLFAFVELETTGTSNGVNANVGFVSRMCYGMKGIIDKPWRFTHILSIKP